MARYAGVEPLSRGSRRKRGADDGLWFAVSGRTIGVDLRQSGQFAQSGGRRWRCALVERGQWDFRSDSRSGGRVRFWWGKAASDRLSRTRQARPAAEYGFAAPRFLRNCGPLMARQPRDPAQESAEGRRKEIDRRGGRGASALHARVSGERACDGSLG